MLGQKNIEGKCTDDNLNFFRMPDVIGIQQQTNFPARLSNGLI